MSEGKKKFFDQFSPKSAYFMGLASGLILIFVVGFFVLLGMLLSDGDGFKKVASNTNTAGQVNPSPNVPTAGTGAVDTDFEITRDDHLLGDFDAPITIVEFSDFECPFCSSFHPTIQRIMDEYPGHVRWVYKHFPLSSIHPNAQAAAEASECAADIGGNEAFWAYGDALFDNQQALNKSTYLRIAGTIGLDTNAFEECFDSGKFRQKVQSDYQEGVAAGVRGTPGSFINGVSIPGAVPYEQIKAVVESLL